MKRESMEFDVVVVGAGPAGLAAACHLKQLAQEDNHDLTVCVLEKGSEVGAHILSGAVFEPRALEEIFSNWYEEKNFLATPVSEDDLYFLSKKKAWAIPHFFISNALKNKGNYIISLGALCRWLAEKANDLGVEIFPGFPAQEILIEEGGVKGVITGDMGIAKDGSQRPEYMPGMELRAKYTLFAEGCRGHLGKQLIERFQLDKGSDPQHYGLGLKEVWEIPKEQHTAGRVVHTFGWPLSSHKTTGGGFLYHTEDGQVSIGLVVDLNYSNPYVDPFLEFQQMKQHACFKSVLTGGKRLSYGARAIAKGGFSSLPKMLFPGGLLIGCDAGTLDNAKIKGTHTAMKSGILAAKSVVEALLAGRQHDVLNDFKEKMEQSWLYKELYRHRNFSPLIHRYGSFFGGALGWLDEKLGHKMIRKDIRDTKPDFSSLQEVGGYQPINYPKPDNILMFDRMSSVFLSNTNHEENQCCHLKLTNSEIPIQSNLPKYAEPAQRYCPAGVYEVRSEGKDDQAIFVINAQNCVHCKTCDIKDPAQNINWVPPEGGGGPNYSNM